MADAAERAFRRFDLNQDGEVSLEELKMGLEKELKVCVYSIIVSSLSLSLTELTLYELIFIKSTGRNIIQTHT